MKTKTEIKAEADLLAKMKPNVRRTSIFGDDHHDSIDAQIRVLDEHLDEDEVRELAEDEGWEENVIDCAVQAVEWMEGNADEAPSTEWKDLLVN